MPDADAPRLLLASASPRRRELLALLGVRFTVVVSRFDEDSLKRLTDPVEYVRAAALGKAEEVASRRVGITLGCDTDVVSPNGMILGKPVDADDAKRLLRSLSGKTHSVYSGVALLESEGGGEVTRRDVRVVETRVTFDDLSDAAINAYVATGDPLDKAGAYGIQSGALAFVSRVDGDLSNVIGLPLPTLRVMFENFGVPLFE
ncbi:MAG: septum formation protein Maf [Akkermansiaceae bacterium]|nr:septum formation protein Maf [Armatimonadota bacterium]